MRVSWSMLWLGLCALNQLHAQESGQEPLLESQQEQVQPLSANLENDLSPVSDFQMTPETTPDIFTSEDSQVVLPQPPSNEDSFLSSVSGEPQEQIEEGGSNEQRFNEPNQNLGTAESLPQSDSEEKSPASLEGIQDTPSSVNVQAQSDAPQITEIDTMSLEEPKGNWLFKRFWWEKAEKTYEKIKNLVDKIAESRLMFFQQRTDIDRTMFDPFYVAIGFEQGELRGLNEFFQNELQQERLIRGTLRAQERAFLQKLVEEKQTIQNIQSDLEVVRKIDTSIDDALSKLIERISEARNYERQAWEKLKAISRELSDLKAHENYLAMDAFWKNVNNINNYISHDFTTYFEELIQKAQTEIDRVKTASQSLREKGIDLRQTAQQLRQITDQSTSEVIDESPDEQEQVTSVSWYQWLWKTIQWPFTSLYSWVSSFFGSAASSSDTEQEPQYE